MEKTSETKKDVYREILGENRFKEIDVQTLETLIAEAVANAIALECECNIKTTSYPNRSNSVSMELTVSESFGSALRTSKEKLDRLMGKH